MKKGLIGLSLLLSGIAFLGACKKTQRCDAPKTPVLVDTKAAFYEHDSIRLNVEEEANTTYSWTLPNGQRVDGDNYILADVDQSYAGAYKVTAYNKDRCDSSSLTINYTVSLLPIPCNVLINVGLYSVSPITSEQYTSVAGVVDGTDNLYTTTAVSQNTLLKCKFYSSAKPASGAYRIKSSSSGLSSHDVYVNLTAVGAPYAAGSGYVYVRNTGGVVDIHFCDLAFVNGSTTFTGDTHVQCN